MTDAAHTERLDDQVADEDPDGDAHGDLADPAQPLPVRRAQAHHCRDGCEERAPVVEDVGRDRPRHPSRDRALADLPRLGTQPSTPLTQRCAAARHGELDEGSLIFLHVIGLPYDAAVRMIPNHGD